MRFRTAACLVLAGLLGATPWPSHAAVGGDLEAAVQTITRKLQQAWASDPGTASLPFPSIEVLPAGKRALAACPAGAPVASANSSGIYCPGSQKVLLDRSWLETDFKNYGQWGIAYWIATALGQMIGSQQNGTTTLPMPAANLEANCFGGVLIGAAEGLQPGREEKLLSPALKAYGATEAGSMGSRSQRAYALLTGLGATDATCSTNAMAALALNQVPDPPRLEQIRQLGEDRGSNSLLAVLSSQCRRLANASCPRRIGRMKP
ncbi:hypothetical protein [Cyanobium sp. ATX-6F1]|uniref:hypothetical protein n=1 Tax=Cyanobium sp. ATX-6F1 TaxID=3137388 RepID=UPI0039BE0938